MQPAVDEQRQPAVVAAEDPDAAGARTSRRAGSSPSRRGSRAARRRRPAPRSRRGRTWASGGWVVEDERGAQRRRRQRSPEHTPRRKCTSATKPRHRPGTRRWRNVSLAASSHGAIATRSHRPSRGPRARRRRGGPGHRRPVSRSGATVAAGRRSASQRGAVRRARPPAPAGRAPGGPRQAARRQRRRGTAAPGAAVPRHRPNEPVEPSASPARAARSAPEARTRAPQQARARGERRRRNDADHRGAALEASILSRPQLAVEGAQRDVAAQRRAAAGNRFGRVAAHHRQRRDRARDDAPGVDDAPRPTVTCGSRIAPGPMIGLVPDAHGHVARAHRFALLMGDDHARAPISTRSRCGRAGGAPSRS